MQQESLQLLMSIKTAEQISKAEIERAINHWLDEGTLGWLNYRYVLFFQIMQLLFCYCIFIRQLAKVHHK